MKIFAVHLLLAFATSVHSMAMKDITNVFTAAADDVTSMFTAFDPNPSVDRMKKSPLGDNFKISMDIGGEGETHLGVDGLTLQLLREELPPSDKLALPGSSGPHPKSSTGALKMQLIEPPTFVSMSGKQVVEVEQQCWEMNWPKYHNCGTLVMGFDLTKGAKRNGATLPAGRIHLSFSIWDQEDLAVQQAERFRVEELCKGYAEEHLKHCRKFEAETNIIKKMFHFRNAMGAAEKTDFSGLRLLEKTPLEHEVTPLGNGFLMGTKGQVWKHGAFGTGYRMFGSAELTALVDESQKLRP